MNRRATRVGSFEVFEVAHVASRIPEIARSNHRRPNLRMNDQVLRVFNGFYKQICSQPKLF
jgi:hypothetical protein